MYYMAHPGKILERWMKERGLSQGALARISGTKQPTIHRIITGESKSPRRATLEPIVRVFGRTVEDLYNENSEPGPISLDARATEFAIQISTLTDDQIDIILRTVAEFQKAP